MTTVVPPQTRRNSLCKGEARDRSPSVVGEPLRVILRSVVESIVEGASSGAWEEIQIGARPVLGMVQGGSPADVGEGALLDAGLTSARAVGLGRAEGCWYDDEHGAVGEEIFDLRLAARVTRFLEGARVEGLRPCRLRWPRRVSPRPRRIPGPRH